MSSRRGRISIEITIIITLTNNLIPLFSLFYNCNYYNCKLKCADIKSEQNTHTKVFRIL